MESQSYTTNQMVIVNTLGGDDDYSQNDLLHPVADIVQIKQCMTGPVWLSLLE